MVAERNESLAGSSIPDPCSPILTARRDDTCPVDVESCPQHFVAMPLERERSVLHEPNRLGEQELDRCARDASAEVGFGEKHGRACRAARGELLPPLLLQQIDKILRRDVALRVGYIALVRNLAD